MPVMKTCRPCVRVKGCDRRRALIEAVRGLGVGTVTHRCPDLALPFRPGQAVWAHVNDTPHSEHDEHEDFTSGPLKGWFPGVFLGLSKRSNTRGLVVIQAGATAQNEAETDREFMPVKGDVKHGVCKVLWSRIRPRDTDAADEMVCRDCGNAPRIMGCGHGGYQCSTLDLLPKDAAP